MSANSPYNEAWAYRAINLQKLYPSKPEQKMKTYIPDAQSSANTYPAKKSPNNASWASIAMNQQKQFSSTPKKINTHLSDAQSSANTYPAKKSPNNEAWAYRAINQQKQFSSTPEEKMKKYLSDAQRSINTVKIELENLHTTMEQLNNKRYEKNRESTLSESTLNNIYQKKRESTLTALKPNVEDALMKSKLALDNVPFITTEDLVDIEKDMELIEKRFKTAKTDMGSLAILKKCAVSLEETWSYYQSLMGNITMGKMAKKMGPYAMGQIYGHSVKQGGSRKRNHKRTQRKHRKRTHRNRK